MQEHSRDDTEQGSHAPSSGLPVPEATVKGLLGTIDAVVFDAFGTLVEMPVRRHSYRRLRELAVAAGRAPRPDDAARIMGVDCDIWGVADWLGVQVSVEAREEISTSLAFETESIRLFPETEATLLALKRLNVRIGLCSNLASPYGPPVDALLPFRLDAYAWSFEVGAVKSDAAIYRSICDRLDVPPERILMIGDTYEADCAGPRRVGMQALHLAREGESPDRVFIRTLDKMLG